MNANELPVAFLSKRRAGADGAARLVLSFLYLEIVYSLLRCAWGTRLVFSLGT